MDLAVIAGQGEPTLQLAQHQGGARPAAQLAHSAVLENRCTGSSPASPVSSNPLFVHPLALDPRCSRLWNAIIDSMIRVVQLPCIVEQDEDGVWCSATRLRPGVGAVGDGPTREASIADLYTALDLLLEEACWPGEIAREGPRPWEGK